MNSSSFVVALWRGCTRDLIRLQPLLPLSVSSSMMQSVLMSTQPVSAARLPYRVKVSAGKRYAWCACGHSKKQPFCDGAHRTAAPTISPLRFTPDKDRTLMLCACKQTKNAPYCDGSHFKVIFQDLVKSVKGVFK
ncbi:CDGSH iron-sulfur domain-containing protein 3, mitochondrial-like [Seriola lalandi dorsalis]|uniref:CDGSH iron-sulfur domain-containing protein 3, mitochondrial-like n=1 Tax=Seriola lalandi dorsalis TaxID=1841481 RepID=A0A3B4WS89_SERLL|nr:CDGSH iron-sulfur domain-containing protein 3, mitochondrial-like [Seriola lalandi dorsalis]XP_056224205.1 CDGSH iron-sulfur domain-containing protein 3, mitochondrial-like [Seriola aureovittata]